MYILIKPWIYQRLKYYGNDEGSIQFFPYRKLLIFATLSVGPTIFQNYPFRGGKIEKSEIVYDTETAYID